MNDPCKRNNGEVKAGLSANIYGAKVSTEATFSVDPVEVKDPKSLYEMLIGVKLSLYTLVLRVFSAPAAGMTALERFFSGCFRPKAKPQIELYHVVVVDSDTQAQEAEFQLKLLEGKPELKKLPPAAPE